jgi:hypothetical protein
MAVRLFRLYAKRAHTPVQVAALQAQRFRRARYVPLVFLELAQNKFPLGSSCLTRLSIYIALN